MPPYLHSCPFSLRWNQKVKMLCHLRLQGLLPCPVPRAAPPQCLEAEDPPCELPSLSTLPTSICSEEAPTLLCFRFSSEADESLVPLLPTPSLNKYVFLVALFQLTMDSKHGEIVKENSQV